MTPDLAGDAGAIVRGRVAVVVLNWNGADDTLDCLASLRRLRYANVHTIVVDNGSADESVAVIGMAFPEIPLIQTGVNLGYAGGNNVGIRAALKAGAEYVMLLNNDTVVDPDCLSALVEAARAHPDGALFGAKIYYHGEPNRIWYAGARWVPEISAFIHLGYGEYDDGRNGVKVVATDYACGCALFIRIDALAAIGLMDESFFLTYEETDWCYRARAHGYGSYFVPQARVWHKISASMGGAESPLFRYYMSRNLLMFASRHLSQAERQLLKTRTLQRLRQSLFWRPGDRSHRLARLWQSLRDPTIRATLAGLCDYYRGRSGYCPRWVRQLARF